MKLSMSVLSLLALLLYANVGLAMDLVRDGRPAATIVVDAAPEGNKAPESDAAAARVLNDWIRKITDVELPVVTRSEGGAAIFVGAAAIRSGLKLDDISSPSHEGLRVRSVGNTILLAGQNDTATMKAACRFLETLGCRYFMDHPLGEVYPRTKTLTVGELNITEKPALAMRRIWGSGWSLGYSLWKTWNGAGGQALGTSNNAWNSLVPAAQFNTHQEWFALQGGQRRNTGWLCTSNPELRHFVAQQVITALNAGAASQCLSPPPDGRGHCQCPRCTALDNPKSLEANGVVSKSNRYTEFYRAVATEVAQACPNAILTFSATDDYTLPPTTTTPLPANLCAYVKPNSVCALHGFGNPLCASRQRVKTILAGWAKHVSKFGYRSNNYNVDDCTLPYAKLTVWQQDLPYLYKTGHLGMDMETLPCWMIYGPHIYLFARLAYTPTANAAAILDDYFMKFYGPAAGPLVKQYFLGLDKAVVSLKCDPAKGARGIDSLAAIYTPAFLAHQRSLLAQAAAAVRGNEQYSARVAMISEGLQNAEQYAQLLGDINRKQISQAMVVHDKIIARNDALVKAGLTNHYTLDFFRHAVTAGKDLLRLTAIAPPNKVLAVLPAAWKSTLDVDGSGVNKGFQETGFDDTGWAMAVCYQAKASTLSGDLAVLPSGQFRWYRSRFILPGANGRIVLVCTELHHDALIYVNGQLASGPNDRPKSDLNITFLADITATVRPGDNVLAIRRPNVPGTLTSKAIAVLELR